MAREIDVRDAAAPIVTTREREEDLLAEAALTSEELPGAHRVRIAAFDQQTGNPSVVVSSAAPAEPGQWVDRALSHVERIGPVLGLTGGQAAEYRADRHPQQTSASAVAVHLRQMHAGIPIYDATETVRFAPDGQLLEVAGRSYSITEPLAVEPRLGPGDAVRIALLHLADDDREPETDPYGQPIPEPSVDPDAIDTRVVSTAADDPERETLVEGAPLAAPTVVSLAWFPLVAGLRLAWRLRLEVGDAPAYRFLVDAEDGRILLCRRVEHGVLGRATIVLRSGGAPEDVPLPLPLDRYGLPIPTDLPTVFPDPWLLDTTTIGNAVRAVRGDTERPASGHRAGDGVEFRPEPGSFDHLVVNAFALCGAAHDAFFLLGFREEDGNFQSDGFGRGGSDGDAVLVRVHPQPVHGTANMATPPDGRVPRMNLGPVTATGRHTALDPDVVFHEYTHGVTNRLVGGRDDWESLDAVQSAGLGEGWSDYVTCTLHDKTVIGDWIVARPQGLRRQPYTEDFTGSYAQLGTPAYSRPHDIGELWCAVLLSLGRRLGPDETLQIVVDALKLTVANPSLLAARDAILMAADHRAAALGANEFEQAEQRALVWSVFARFGMGPSAGTIGATLNGISADFSLPAAPALA
ncbi:M36 family metallopeptidase [Cryptosporangium aurantiacum]|uniref:Extracellular elastinolytic metalloproteinase n=1 Tax=Cryptosporangium aurantiacum TaxID=134849 RepID=A0A1M7R2G5_9ACTN|nr:M36 family metallopeptidase [Cryptosporangium aurantiacum]SHN38820.1 extracellular elastinolytic metalloproteinase [Cryptosporangium aurantiacum]